ncbi:hypothetical protein LQW54_000912 [Pestalotiopsis sp. IQ-011]
MGQVINGWGNVTDFANAKIFDGTQEPINVHWSVMSNGEAINGKFDGKVPEDESEEQSESQLWADIGKSFFGHTIPALWQISGTYAFVIDSGYGCDKDKPLDDYLEDDTMDATGACVDGTLYYLVYPKGEATECECHYYDDSHCERQCRDNKFSAPPGLDSLDRSNFGGITKEDLITSSVRTWLQNGKTNGGGFADPTHGGTIDNLLNVDVTTPGYMRLPVCSPERAFRSWDTTSAGSSANYPCHGSCKIGVEATKINGNVNFEVGGQDVIDIINEAVKQFGGSGKVGAKGYMSCNGNIKSQAVMWGIY